MKWLIIISLFLATTACVTTNKDIEVVLNNKIDADNSSFSLIGRFDTSDPKEAMFAWSSSKIAFDFEGSNCAVLLDSVNNSDVYFDVQVDDNKPFILRVNSDSREHHIVKNLEFKRHSISIERRNEYFEGASIFKGIVLESDAQILPYSRLNERFIEYIGDSNSAGYGVEASGKEEPYTTETSNSRKSYAGYASRLLNSEYSIIAWSGKGVYRNGDMVTEGTMPDYYDSITELSDSSWSFKNYNPDLVVINLGPNDFAGQPPEEKDFRDAYINFIIDIKSKNNNVPVVCLVGQSMSNSWPINKETGNPYRTLDTIKKYMKGVKSELSDLGIDVDLIEVPPLNSSYSYGADYHPGVMHNKETGKYVANEIKKIMNW